MFVEQPLALLGLLREVIQQQNLFLSGLFPKKMLNFLFRTCLKKKNQERRGGGGSLLPDLLRNFSTSVFEFCIERGGERQSPKNMKYFFQFDLDIFQEKLGRRIQIQTF